VIKIKQLLASIFVFACISTQASTQEDNLFSLSLEELLQVKVTSTSRNPELINLAPSAITVFTREELDRMGITTLSQLLNLVTGVQALFEPHESRANLLVGRGTPESWGQGFLLMLDGERLNEYYTGGFVLQNRHVSLSNIKRVEVIRGPGSALYGSNAFNGVISLISDRSTDQYRAYLGSDNAYRINASKNINEQDWRLNVFAELFEDSGQTFQQVFDRFDLQNETSDPREGEDAEILVGYRNTTITLRHSERNYENFYVLGRLADGINRENVRHDYARIEHLFEHELGNTRLAYSHHNVDWKPFTRLVPQGEAPFTQADWLFGPILEYRTDTFHVDSTIETDAGKFNFGGSFEEASLPTASIISNYDPIDVSFVGELVDFTDAPYRVVADRKREAVGLYFQHQYNWTEYWSSTLGLRYDDFNDVGNHLTPRVAVVYSPQETHTFKGMWGKAFRAPGLGDLYDQEAGRTIGNPNLSHIVAETLEFSYHYNQKNYSTNFTLFDVRAKNLLSVIPLPSGQTLASNIGENISQGVEFEYSYSPAQEWLIKLSATAITKNDSSQFMDPDAQEAEQYSPSRYGSLIINWQKDRWNLNLNGFWRNDIPIIENGSAQHFNFAASYQVNKEWSLKFRVENLNDNNYNIVARGSGLGRNQSGEIVRNVPVRGRSWLLGAEWRPQ